MKKRIKKLTAVLLAFALTLSFGAPAFAQQLWSTDTKSAGGYGNITGSLLYAGMFTDLKKVVSYGTEVTQLSGGSATLRGYMEIKDYRTGEDRGRINVPATKNQKKLNYSWKGQNDAVNKQEISVYGYHEVSGSGTYYSRTNIYGF